jgi:hypothetical protein
METRMSLTRRKYLAGMGGALLAATPLAASCTDDDDSNDGDTFYGHGMVWNRELPGAAGEVRLSFDLRVNLETGAGFGSAHDPVFPDWGIHFSIESTERESVGKGENRYTMSGVVTKANSSANAGLPVRIVAETRDQITAIVIRLGDMVFMGAGLVVIAIIAILIGLLVPAVQKDPPPPRRPR